jgi:uncharacterized membrane protein
VAGARADAVHLGLSDALPPEAIRSSIMSILIDSYGAVYYIDPISANGDIAHVLIGGRPEPGETYQQAIIREAAEKTGAVIEPIAIIGIAIFINVSPALQKQIVCTEIQRIKVWLDAHPARQACVPI